MSDKLSAHGDLLGAPYHDGLVCGLCIHDDTIDFKIAKDQFIINLAIHNVKLYGFHPFRKDNVLSYIIVTPSERWLETSVDKNGEWDVLMGGELSQRNLLSLRDNCIKQYVNDYLFSINFSYGAYISIIGTSWKISSTES